jgi:hypothetical protein
VQQRYADKSNQTARHRYPDIAKVRGPKNRHIKQNISNTAATNGGYHTQNYNGKKVGSFFTRRQNRRKSESGRPANRNYINKYRRSYHHTINLAIYQREHQYKSL